MTATRVDAHVHLGEWRHPGFLGLKADLDSIVASFGGSASAVWRSLLMIHTGRWQQAAGYGLALQRAEVWPKLQFILSHAGGDTPELCLGAVQRLGLANVAFDTAGLREHWALERALQVAGPERYLLGSDSPLATPAMYLAQIEALHVPSSWKDGLLGGNARRVLGEPSRPGKTAISDGGSRAAVGARVPEINVEHRAEHTVLITGAGGPIGVNLTRSLRLAKRRLRLIGTDANRYHRPLALTDCCLAVPRATYDSCLAKLNEIIVEHGVELVLPTHPVDVRALSGLRERVSARLFLPPHQTILAGQDQYCAYERFREARVPVARRASRRSTPAGLHADGDPGEGHRPPGTNRSCDGDLPPSASRRGDLRPAVGHRSHRAQAPPFLGGLALAQAQRLISDLGAC